MREIIIKQSLLKKLLKISKKDSNTYLGIMKKIMEVANSADVEHYKNLRYDMKESKRVHLGHFVLIFSYDKVKDVVVFEDYEHHDVVY